MKHSKVVIAFSFVIAISLGASPTDAKMKAKYYKDCYAHVAEARELVPEPPVDVGGTAKAVGEVAGVVGRLGGFGGLGGLASKASQVAQYSGYVASAADLANDMQEDYPDPAARLEAYGMKMGENADDVGLGLAALNNGITCYQEADTNLRTNLEAGEIKSRTARNHQKEIVKGVAEAKDILKDAQTIMDQNRAAYEEALTTDPSEMGLTLTNVSRAVSVGRGATSAAGVGAGYGGNVWAAGNAQARLMAAQASSAGWDNLYTRQDKKVDPATLAAYRAQVETYNANPTALQQTTGALDSVDSMSRLGSLAALGRLTPTAAGMVAGQTLLQEGVSAALNNEQSAPEARAEPELPEDMLNSLARTSGQTAKFMAVYSERSRQSAELNKLEKAAESKL